jgi:hypothetical protein
MDFNLVSKQNIGYATSLLLIVLLSQSKFFNFLLDTTLGRSILILFILFISYVNKILGVVVVLFIIILFNNSDIGYIEGFTDNSNTTQPSSSEQQKKTTTTPATSTSSTTTSNAASVPTDTSDIKSLPTPNDTTTTTATSSASSQAVEGFDIVGKERWMQKGKQSNQIPVNDFMRESPDIAPYDGSSFSESFSSY